MNGLYLKKAIFMSFKFEKLEVWKKTMVLGEEIDSIAETFPNKEIFNLTSQIRRAADSVALNISEGSILQSDPEQKKFLGYSIRSLAEVVTCLYKARNRNYIDKDYFKEKYDFCYHLMNMLIAYRRNFL